MKNFYVGYYDSKDIFVIFATTTSRAVAMFIRDSYRAAYEKIGIQTGVLIYKEEELPKKHRNAQD